MHESESETGDDMAPQNGYANTALKAFCCIAPAREFPLDLKRTLEAPRLWTMPRAALYNANQQHTIPFSKVHHAHLVCVQTGVHLKPQL